MSNFRYSLNDKGQWVAPGEIGWLALADQRGWSSGVQYTERAILWLELQKIVRSVLWSLVDGRSYCSRRSGANWLGRLSSSIRYWRYHVESRVFEVCQRLGVEIPASFAPQMGVAQVGEFLRRSEPVLLDTPREISIAPYKVAIPDVFDGTVYQDWPAKHLSALMTRLRDAQVSDLHLYLHGSMASLDYTAFSDIDDLVVIRRGCWKSDAALRQTANIMATIARGFQVIDPFQHHGHFLVTEFDLGCYDESVIPLVVLENAKAVSGPQQFMVLVRDSRAEFRQSLWDTIQGIRALAVEGQSRGLNLYWLKHLVGKIALLPALLFQSQGMCLDKPKAIARSRKVLDEEAWEAIEWATYVRSNWQEWVPAARLLLLRSLVRLFAARRHHAEALIARLMPRLDVCATPSPDAQTWTSILCLTDRASEILGELVTNDCR